MKDEDEIKKVTKKLKQVEAELIEQEHRPLQIIWNFLNRNKAWEEGDPRRKASAKALIWRLFFSPTTIAIASGGFLGLATLFFLIRQDSHFQKQNDLIDLQNQKIEIQNNRIIQQTYLQEADRRSSLVFLSSNVLDRIDNELKSSSLNDRNLSDQLIGRIVSLSRSLKPYRYLEQDTLSFLTSPERGQLLISLINSKLGENTYQRIFKDGDFSFSELTNITFEEVNFGNINLSNSFLTNVDFDKCKFSKPKLNKSFISGMDINNSRIDEIDFTSSIIVKLETSNTICKFLKLDLSYINDLALKESSYGYISSYQSILNDCFISGSLINKFRLIHNDGSILKLFKHRDTEKFKLIPAFDKLNDDLVSNFGSRSYIFIDHFINYFETNELGISKFDEVIDFPIIKAKISPFEKENELVDRLFDNSDYKKEEEEGSLILNNTNFSQEGLISALTDEYEEEAANWNEYGLDNQEDLEEFQKMKNRYEFIISQLKNSEINDGIENTYYDIESSSTYFEYSLVEQLIKKEDSTE